MEAFTATLPLDPLLLQGLRHRLSAWLEKSGASREDHDSVVLATHEAAAHAIQTADGGSMLDVTADRDEDESFVVHVQTDGGWTPLDENAPHNVGRLTDLMTDVSLRSSSALRLRRARTLSIT